MLSMTCQNTFGYYCYRRQPQGRCCYYCLPSLNDSKIDFMRTERCGMLHLSRLGSKPMYHKRKSGNRKRRQKTPINESTWIRRLYR
jgi:hypothetical protein